MSQTTNPVATMFTEFVSSLENVPPELERNFTLIRELDQRTEECMEMINKCVKEYEEATSLSSRAAIKKESNELFDRLQSYSDDKVELATRTYNMIDKNINRLMKMCESSSELANEGQEQPAIGYDMPQDPNEPKYCYCGSISHGTMVACENEECPLEWFHLGCVGLTEAPKGQWYCKNCSEPARKKMKLMRKKKKRKR